MFTTMTLPYLNKKMSGHRLLAIIAIILIVIALGGCYIQPLMPNH